MEKKKLEKATVYNCCPQINPLFHIILTNFRLNQSINSSTNCHLQVGKG